MDWSGVDYLWSIVMFLPAGLSIWRHPFTAEDPLLSKWCNATFLQICSDEETHLEWWVSIFLATFWMNNAFKPHYLCNTQKVVVIDF